MKAETECIVINGARRAVQRHCWKLKRSVNWRDSVTFPVILICNLGLTEALQVLLADHSI